MKWVTYIYKKNIKKGVLSGACLSTPYLYNFFQELSDFQTCELKLKKGRGLEIWKLGTVC